MKSTEDIRNFLNAFVDWAAVQGDVHAIALWDHMQEAQPETIRILTWFS